MGCLAAEALKEGLEEGQGKSSESGLPRLPCPVREQC